MPAKWQRWMPFHIDRFRGSPEVQSMHPAARLGYIYLLASAWQSDDCSLSPDPLDLATESGLGDELWAKYGPRILRKFSSREDGRLTNEVVYLEWADTKRIYESRSQAADRTNSTRSPSRKATVTAGSPSRSGHGHRDTLTKTETTTKPRSKPLAPRDRAAAASPLFSSPPVVTLLLNSGEEFPVTADDIAEWSKAFPGVDMLPELHKMRLWCLNNSRNRKTKSGIHKFITSWFERTQNKGGVRNHGNANSETAGHLSTLARFAARRGIEGRGGADEVGDPAPGSAE